MTSFPFRYVTGTHLFGTGPVYVDGDIVIVFARSPVTVGSVRCLDMVVGISGIETGHTRKNDPSPRVEHDGTVPAMSASLAQD